MGNSELLFREAQPLDSRCIASPIQYSGLAVVLGGLVFHKEKTHRLHLHENGLSVMVEKSMEM